MEEDMNRQIRNAISSLMIVAIAGIGLMAFGQNPCCPQPCVVQPVQPQVPVVQQQVIDQVVQPVAQPCPAPCPQPVVQPVAPICPAPCPQTVTCPAPCPQPVQPVVEQHVIDQVVQPCPQPVQPVVEQQVIDQVVQPCPAPCQQPCQPVSFIQAQGFAQTVAFGGNFGDARDLAREIERNADDLKKYFRRSLRCLDCVSDEYYDNVKEFESATDRLRRDARRNDCDLGASVNEVLRLAECISAYMDPCSLCPEAIEAWNCLRGDLQTLAGQFCNTVCFQQPISLQPACVAPQPAIFVQPVQPAPTCCPGNINY